MEQLEKQIKRQEYEYVHKVGVILTMNYSDRLKAQLINKHYWSE